MNTFGRALLATTALGTATIAYAAGIERRNWTLREATLPVLKPGSAPLRVLHLSDLHMTPNQKSKQRWVAELDSLEPDLVVNTGDNLAHQQAVPAVLRALGPLLDRPGVFVFGSNDYYAPRPKNPARYLLPSSKTKRIHGVQLPWRDLRAAMIERGWLDLTHVRRTFTVAGQTVFAAGLDDPHLKRDRYQDIAGKPEDAALRLGVTHSPEPRVLDPFAADGYDLVMAGHTHGGQLRVPGYGALVTNCELDRSRARGASRWGEHTWLHVSAGLGTSPYAPVRFACPPEASLLTLVPRPVDAGQERSEGKRGTRFGVGGNVR
ncbi:metallophosphoesterase [Saccharothrix coeruleofusca]|uniref:Metallophosphoesterase n=1 Tax=Saccharothrix coeruleofusca TaxID=33919 RepID=A0A918AHC1_9PSEU|nr:metallophosphoesterase [Saccharothrix coeruleofusca]MBP2340287.1 putative MPP superfamily phosphohydrolase [Saccharothrix coeruleofusca]GGP36412.1 metallophosphoesterase [Saccharothrix coeruleofusca]